MRLRGLLVAAVVVTVTAGCRGPDGPPGPDPPDQSLPAADYVREGLPTPDRAWSAPDLAAAAAALRKVAGKGWGRLPRADSPNSGAVFARLTAPDHARGAADEGLTVSYRLEQTAARLRAAGDVLKLYNTAHLDRAVAGTEVVDLTGLILRIEADLLPLAERTAAASPFDPLFSPRQTGLQQVKGGTTNTVAGAMAVLADRKRFRAAERARLAGHLRDSLPRIAPRLPLGAAGAVAHLDRLIADRGSRDIRSALTELRAAVAAAAGK